MAKLDITGLDDELLAWFAHRAHRLGQSEVDLARTLVEREARSEQTWQALEDSSARMRDRLRTMQPARPRSRRNPAGS